MKTNPRFLNRIVVKFHDQDDAVASWQHILEVFPGVRIQRLFTSLTPERIGKLVSAAGRSDSGYQAPDLLAYHMLSCPAEIDAGLLQKLLLSNRHVELAYVQAGIPAPPSIDVYDPLNNQQQYLDPAPVGINARYAWSVKGGDGAGRVNFIDIERGWLLQHEDINVSTLPCTGINDWRYEEHGLAVLGIIMMHANGTGGIGIVPQAKGYVVSEWRQDGTFNTADAILAATEELSFGDVLLLESQVLRYNDGDTAWPAETEDAVWQAVRLATALGIIVIEPAGNGNSICGNNLDDFIEASGKRILNCVSPYFKDSGAVMVAAASCLADHHRLGYSNYGNRINCFAPGEKIATAGSYPDSSGAAINTYTHRFDGTSGAAAIIAGAAIAVQSMSEANFSRRLSPPEMREILGAEKFATLSANGRADKIGVMPDLKRIIDEALNIRPGVLNGGERPLNGSIVHL